MLGASLDLLGVACLAVFAFLIWPPLALPVLGAACLAASFSMSRRPTASEGRQ